MTITATITFDLDERPYMTGIAFYHLVKSYDNLLHDEGVKLQEVLKPVDGVPTCTDVEKRDAFKNFRRMTDPMNRVVRDAIRAHLHLPMCREVCQKTNKMKMFDREMSDLRTLVTRWRNGHKDIGLGTET